MFFFFVFVSFDGTKVYCILIHNLKHALNDIT